MAKNYTNKEIGDWMTGKAKSASGYRNKIMSNNDRNRDATVIGKMYFFWYDPKHKDTLPMYDRFPLVFPIERYADGFLGLNLHYLSFGERSALLNTMMKFRNNNKMDATTKLRVTYDLLNGVGRIASAMRPCIKRYLFSQVRSSFVEVTADEWDKAMQLPVAVWVSKG